MSRLIYTGRDEEGILLHVFAGRNWTKKWHSPSFFANQEEERYYEDFEDKTVQRIILGRLTKRRYQIIERYCRKNSRNQSDIYGKGYCCGCEHDCCGCLTGEWMSARYFKHWKGYKIVINFTQSFNY